MASSKLVIVDRFFPPIKTYSACGYVKEDLGFVQPWQLPGLDLKNKS